MKSGAGLGPWHVALLFNLNCKKRQTELRVHGSVHWVAPFYNLIDPRNLWVTIMVVGPFYEWQDASHFHALWSKQTRGKIRRLRRGVSLFHTFREKHDIWMWIQSETEKKLRREAEQLRERNAICRKFNKKIGKTQRIKMLLYGEPGTIARKRTTPLTLGELGKIKRKYKL